MLHKVSVLLSLLFVLVSTHAQEKTKVKLGIDGGIHSSQNVEYLSLFLNVEPKLKLSERSALGLRVGLTGNHLEYDYPEDQNLNVNGGSNNGLISLVPVIDYFFGEKNVRPFLGLGVGPYILTGLVDVTQFQSTPAETLVETKIKDKMGALVRGGLESRKMRFGLEYNIVPEADIELSDNHVIGQVNRGYFGMSIGVSIGNWDSAN